MPHLTTIASFGLLVNGLLVDAFQDAREEMTSYDDGHEDFETESEHLSYAQATGECDLSRYDFGDRFTVTKKLGSGANGCVVLANDKKNGDVAVAVKVSKKPGKKSSWVKECKQTKDFHKLACKAGGVHAKLAERFLPNCLEVGGSDAAPFIVMHNAGGEGLGPPHILRKAVPSTSERLSVFAQIVGALYGLTGIGMSHNDLHTKNVVYYHKGVPVQICFIDFGETVPFARGHYKGIGKTGSYKQDENLLIDRARDLSNCPAGGKEDLIACLKTKWSGDGADDDFLKVFGEVYDETAAKKHPVTVEKLYETKFIQKHLPKLDRLFPNTECGKQPPQGETSPTPAPTPAPPTPSDEDPAKIGSYVKHAGKNCYPHSGAASGDNDAQAKGDLSVEECQQRCDADSKCNCFIISHAGKCWRRKDCQPDKCGDASWADAYVKATSGEALVSEWDRKDARDEMTSYDDGHEDFETESEGSNMPWILGSVGVVLVGGLVGFMCWWKQAQATADVRQHGATGSELAERA